MDNWYRRILGVAVAGTLAVGLAACGDDDDDDVQATDPPTEETTGDTGTTDTSAGAPGDTVQVTAIDYGYADLPATISAGTTLSLTNESATEVHELVAMRIPDSETRPVSELLALPEPELDALFGSAEPATVIVAGPGDTPPQINAVGDGTIAEPGRYAIVCFVPEGADPAEFFAAAEGSDGPPEVAGGPPHVALGMFAELIVE